MWQNQNIKFVLAVGFQTLAILVLVVYKYLIFAGGTEVLLRIEPVDPRDLLRGDYVTFGYDISQPYSYGERFRNGQKVYVTLVSGGRYWYAGDVSPTRPLSEEIYIEGTVAAGGSVNQEDSGRLTIEYGIEDYFIPEKSGRNVNITNKEAAALVSVDDRGQAVLKKIFLDGHPWP